MSLEMYCLLLDCPRLTMPKIGTLAAAFQSWAYGGFTPAGGIFATLTSLGMLGWLAPLQTALAMGIATAVTAVLQICGMGA